MSLETNPSENSIKSIISLIIQMTFAIALFTVLFTLSVDSSPVIIDEDATCGYEACPAYDADALNVHLIPHSHDDVGWQRTVDQYFYQEVQTIISAVIPALKQNPDRRYVQVETAFFSKWWEQQPDNIKQDVINLVNSGRLEFIGGGWSMNDEAAVHYQSTIDQFTLGLRYLVDNLGKCARPVTGWQIDPFGHSREQASISAQLGFDNLIFVRIDYRDKQHRLDTKTADIIWRGSQSLGNSSDIFTSITYQHYSAPVGFCFDHVCNDEPIIDDEDSPDYNYRQRVEDFASYVAEHADNYATNNILVTMGDDFRYQAALNYFINLDRLIKGFELFPQTYNGRPIRLIYSTPKCYSKFVNEFVTSQNFELQLKTDDFFPYADTPDTYWTGYFTSRPTSKRFERTGNNMLQVAKQLSAITGGSYDNPQIRNLKEAMGIMQHHDAITGTEQQHVTNNYHLTLTKAMNEASEASNVFLSTLIGGEDANLEFKSCLLVNVSVCEPAQGEKFTVAIYNPLSRKVNSPVSIPVNYDAWKILDASGEEVVYQISDPIRDFSYVDNVPVSKYVLEFTAKDIPGLGYIVYRFERSSVRKFKSVEPQLTVGFEDTSFEFDNTTGLLTYVTMNGIRLEVAQELLYYTSTNTSGAYIFVPSEDGVKRVSSEAVKITQISGEVYQGVIQEYSEWAKQTIKVYNDDRSYIEFEWILGPINIGDGPGKEVISRFSTYLKSEGQFYTDSNGRELMQRTRNSRSDYNYTNEQPVSANYYPVNSKILIRDEGEAVEVAVLTDRSEGGSSLDDGQFEIMLHRVCHHDDGRGAHEALNETEYNQPIVVRGKYYLVLGKITGDGGQSLAAVERDVAQRKLLAPWFFVTDKEVAGSLVNLRDSALKSDLPINVQILTLEPWQDDTLLIRLEHVLAKDEDENLSKDVTVDLSGAFSKFTITELQETTLGANILLEEHTRMQWPGRDETEEFSDVLSVERRNSRDVEDLQITLAPMQIRTFLAKIKIIIPSNAGHRDFTGFSFLCLALFAILRMLR